MFAHQCCKAVFMKRNTRKAKNMMGWCHAVSSQICRIMAMNENGQTVRTDKDG